MALLLVVQWLERDLAGKPGPTFPDHAQKPGILSRLSAIFSENRFSLFPDHALGPRPKKGSPA